MSVADEIKKILEEKFEPVHLKIRDISHRHEGHEGHDGSGEGHFNVTIVSPAFEGLSRLERQRAVYGALEELMKSRIHALALKTFSVREYS